jgi:hypothetical protein
MPQPACRTRSSPAKVAAVRRTGASGVDGLLLALRPPLDVQSVGPRVRVDVLESTLRIADGVELRASAAAWVIRRACAGPPVVLGKRVTCLMLNLMLF